MTDRMKIFPLARRVATIVLASVLSAAAAPVSVASDIEIGMNYNWWRFAPKTQEECRAHPASPFRGNWLLPRYQDKDVRDAVRDQLREMRRAGFTLLKIFVYHRRPHLSRDIEFFFSEDGSLAPEDRTKLQNFVSDIASAGFKGLEVATGFIDQNASVWGSRECGG
jgi:hypothetical protein